MTLAEAVRTCLRKYFVFSGRASRPEFWMFVLATILVSVVISVFDMIIFGPTEEALYQTTVVNGVASHGLQRSVTYGSGPLSSAYGLLVTVPVLAAAFRRMHDTGRPGWYLLGLWISAAALLAVSLLGFSQQIPTDSATLAMFPDFPETMRVPHPPIWLFLTSMVAWFVSFVLAIVWLARLPQPGPNKYGPNPTEVNT